jgi:glycosyltransferase involved in cell wall biosynthesis
LSHFLQPGRRHLNDFLQAGSLACDIKRAAFAHLHVHFANVPATVGELVQSLCGIRFSVTAHAKDIYLTPPGELARKMRKATCVLTCTAYNQRYLAGLNHGDTPIHLAHHGIDAGRFGGATEQTAESDGEAPLILSVGRFCEKKGFEYLIAACQILKQRGREFRCLIIGYGELQEKLEKMISALGLAGCVSLPGRMTQGQLAALYPKSSMFVLPCLVTDNGDRDGIPNVMIEAMASRVPVISTNISGIAELVEDGKNGLLVEQRSAQQIAAAIENLLLQPALRKHMGNMGHEKVTAHFTLESSAARVFHILDGAMCGAQTDESLSAPRVVATAS